MTRCLRCLIPDTRPDTAFVDGVCSACLSYENRPSIDWRARRAELERLLEETPKNGSGFDCIVPSSGGKDSTWQTLALIDMGANPLVVTARTCHLTELGRANIDNLARLATTYEIVPNMATRARLNRIGLEVVGDISWPEHVAIFTTPFKVAVQTGIPLIFYGENPQNQYGGPLGSESAREMTQRWVSEFGGFLGLRVSDVVAQWGLDMREYVAPSAAELARVGVQAHFLGQYLGWDSHRNAEDAEAAGFKSRLPTTANWWDFENLDNAQTGLHDWMMWKKHGLSRAAQQLSVDIRHGLIGREVALKCLQAREGKFPYPYAGVSFGEVCSRIGMLSDSVLAIADRFSGAR